MEEGNYYNPGEDSYALYDILQEENIKNSMVLDVGSSTGFLAKAFDETNIVISSDINFKALNENKNAEKIQTSLLKGINTSKIDVIIFNPPYVPLIIETGVGDGIDNVETLIDPENITGGNLCGNKIILEFIEMLNFDGIIYLLIILANKPKIIIDALVSKGLEVELKKTKKIQGETIIILKAYFPPALYKL